MKPAFTRFNNSRFRLRFLHSPVKKGAKAPRWNSGYHYRRFSGAVSTKFFSKNVSFLWRTISCGQFLPEIPQKWFCLSTPSPLLGENGISFVVRKGAPAGIVLPIYVHSSGGEEGNVYASALKKRPPIFLIHLNKKYAQNLAMKARIWYNN